MELKEGTTISNKLGKKSEMKNACRAREKFTNANESGSREGTGITHNNKKCNSTSVQSTSKLWRKWHGISVTFRQYFAVVSIMFNGFIWNKKRKTGSF